MFPRVYQSFEDFERFELRKLDGLYESVDGMMDEMLLSEAEEDRYRDDDNLFDEIEEEEEEEED
jgi:hypothetical protein